MISSVAAILKRDLACLRRELEQYPDEADLWRLAPGISNSAGTLALHLAGNLRHFIGGVLGGSGYQRDREAEFAGRGVPRGELLAQIDAAGREVAAALDRLNAAALERDYPLKVAERTLRTGDFLLHLCGHLAYHLGQVDYHRRFVTGQTGKAGAVAPGELHSARP